MRVLDCTMSQDILAICYDPFLSGCDPLMRGKKAAVASSGAAAPAASDAGRSRAAVSRGRNNDQCTVKKRRCFFPFILSRSEPSADSCVDKDKEEVRVESFSQRQYLASGPIRSYFQTDGGFSCRM